MEKNELEIPYFNKDKEKEKNLNVVKKEEESKTLITQVFGDMDVSQSVKAYKASIVTSGDTPGARWMMISTC